MSASPSEVEARLEAALDMVRALCSPRGTAGARSWNMSIPARPDHDPDLVIAASLHDLRKLLPELAAVTRERDALRLVLQSLVDAKAEKDANGDSAKYRRMKDGVWERARETLAALESGDLRNPAQKPVS